MKSSSNQSKPILNTITEKDVQEEVLKSVWFFSKKDSIDEQALIYFTTLCRDADVNKVCDGDFDGDVNLFLRQ